LHTNFADISRDRCTLSKCKTLPIPLNAILQDIRALDREIRALTNTFHLQTLSTYKHCLDGIGRLAEEPLLGPRFYRAFWRFEYQAFETQTRCEDAGGDVTLLIGGYSRFHVHLRYGLVLSQFQGDSRHFWLFERAQHFRVLRRTA